MKSPTSLSQPTGGVSLPTSSSSDGPVSAPVSAGEVPPSLESAPPVEAGVGDPEVGDVSELLADAPVVSPPPLVPVERPPTSATGLLHAAAHASSPTR
jgi:hypothetical protein